MTTGSSLSVAPSDPLVVFDPAERATLAAIADRLIPAAHDMPSAADVLGDDRLRFVLGARPDLVAPLRVALRPGLGSDPGARLEALGRDEPASLGALQLVIVAGYYTDRDVRDRIGYPGQLALTVKSWEYPTYLEEGLIDAVIARGPVWRDPATGRRATAAEGPRTYAEMWAEGETGAGASADGPAEGGSDGRDGG